MGMGMGMGTQCRALHGTDNILRNISTFRLNVENIPHTTGNPDYYNIVMDLNNVMAFPVVLSYVESRNMFEYDCERCVKDTCSGGPFITTSLVMCHSNIGRLPSV